MAVLSPLLHPVSFEAVVLSIMQGLVFVDTAPVSSRLVSAHVAVREQCIFLQRERIVVYRHVR